eukprot:3103569-Lingulodinium_polyedra.AAC.1
MEMPPNPESLARGWNSRVMAKTTPRFARGQGGRVGQDDNCLIVALIINIPQEAVLHQELNAQLPSLGSNPA